MTHSRLVVAVRTLNPPLSQKLMSRSPSYHLVEPSLRGTSLLLAVSALRWRPEKSRPMTKISVWWIPHANEIRLFNPNSIDSLRDEGNMCLGGDGTGGRWLKGTPPYIGKGGTEASSAKQSGDDRRGYAESQREGARREFHVQTLFKGS